VCEKLERTPEDIRILLKFFESLSFLEDLSEPQQRLLARDFLGLYLTLVKYVDLFFRSAPTARSPRAATHDSRLAEKFGVTSKSYDRNK